MNLKDVSVPKDRLASVLAVELKALLGPERVGGLITIAPDSDLCSALELFLPRLLRSVYPAWNTESLDGLFVEQAVKSNESTLVIRGACIIMSDQTLTPFFAELFVSQEANARIACLIRLGEPGRGTLGISGPKCASREATGYRQVLIDRYEHIQWVYVFPIPRESIT